MVEQVKELDSIFASLSDPTRRDILRKVSKRSLSVGEVATYYPLSLAAVAKHLDVLHRAQLISKSRRGKQQIVSISPKAFAAAGEYFDSFAKLWEQRLGNLHKLLLSTKSNKGFTRKK